MTARAGGFTMRKSHDAIIFPKEGRIMRRKVALFFCFLMVLLLLSACALPEVSAPAQQPPAQDSSFSVSFLDVGQADSALVACDGHFLLIDGGNVDDGAFVCSALAERGVKTLDCVVNSHCDEDHCGGLTAVLEEYDTACVYSSTTEYDSRAFSNFADAARAQGSAIEIPTVGDSFFLGSAEVAILGPLRDYGNNNDNSIVLRVDYGETSFLFTGDMGITPEDELVESGCDLDVTVLKVGHHGSAGSTGYVFLRDVMPQYAVICVGADNPYGHPTDAALSRLRDAQVTLFRTDLQGTVTATSDGKTVSFTTERTASAEELNPTILETAGRYIGNVNSKVFHRDDCGNLPAEKNQIVFDRYQDAIDAGYTPHKGCIK